jgi:Spy/CpxP family protein refolding chaperone
MGLSAALALALLIGASAGAFGRHAGGFSERRIERMLDAVEASDEQRVEVRAAFDELHDLWRESRRERRDSREAIAAALTGEEIDREALEALRADQVASFEARSQQLLGALVRVAQALTPEQRRQVAEHMEEHRDHREHRDQRAGRGWH